MTRSVAIVGGGISGLATAYFLQQSVDPATPLEVTLVESEDRVGGRIVSETIDECVLEGGPDSFLTLKPQALDLCEELGLSDLLVGTNPAMSKVYVFCGGKLRTLPEGLTSVVPRKLTPFLKTDLMTTWGKARMLLDVFVPRRREEGDESLANFVRRRLGTEALLRIAEPLMAGIYAGDSEQLSMETNFPQLVQMEKEHRSLVLGALRGSRGASPERANAARRPTFMTLRGGLEVMVDALVARLGATRILKGRKPVSLRIAPAQAKARYELELEDGTFIDSDAVVLAIPAYAAATLLAGLNPNVASILKSIPYVSTATVSLIYDRANVSSVLDGSGFVVAPSEGRRITACTWVSSKWPVHSPANRVSLRCFLGRAGEEEILEKSDEDLAQVCLEEIRSILGIGADPLVVRVHRCGWSLPQYNLGHSQKLTGIEESMRSLPGVFLTGAAYKGVGLPDCVKQGARAADNVLGFLSNERVGSSAPESVGQSQAQGNRR